MDKSCHECGTLLWWLMDGFEGSLKLNLMPIFAAPKKSLLGKYRYPKELHELHEALSGEIFWIRKFSNENNFSGVKYHCEQLFHKIELHCNTKCTIVPNAFIELKKILIRLKVI
ncbi:MAG TPA: hypothetical protein VL995_09680 [Cellvibrio sp.]|nr:hypothetical protein [Cellvibrio sp.]